MNLKILFIVISIFSFSFFPSKSEDKTQKKLDPHKYNFYTGMFDFSDQGKRSALFGIQHRNEDLYREANNKF